jgi:hypothetical protein
MNGWKKHEYMGGQDAIKEEEKSAPRPPENAVHVNGADEDSTAICTRKQCRIPFLHILGDKKKSKKIHATMK